MGYVLCFALCSLCRQAAVSPLPRNCHTFPQARETPVSFEPIVDRFAESNTYLARSGRIQINFSSAGFQILPTSGDGLFSLDVRLAGANPKQQILAAEKTGGESNYLLGADPSMSSPSSPIGNEGERQPTLARPN